MSIQHRGRHWTRPGTRGPGHVETTVRVHQGCDADPRLFGVREKDPSPSDRTESFAMGPAAFHVTLLQLETEHLAAYFCLPSRPQG